MSENIKIINLNYLNEISSGIDFRNKIFSLFRLNVSEFKTNMEFALNNENYSELGEQVHKAKSSLKILGMTIQADELNVLESDINNLEHTNTYKKRILDFFSVCEKALLEIEIIENQT